MFKHRGGVRTRKMTAIKLNKDLDSPGKQTAIVRHCQYSIQEDGMKKMLKVKKSGKRMVNEFRKTYGLKRPDKVEIPIYRGEGGFYTTPYAEFGIKGYYLNCDTYGTNIFDRFGRIKKEITI